jgi:hypothetical protein
MAYSFEIRCPYCDGLIGLTDSTQPLPSIYHRPCFERANERDKSSLADDLAPLPQDEIDALRPFLKGMNDSD